jgi:hypothetical protein
LRASHAEIFIDVAGDTVRLRGRVRTMPQKLIAAVLVERMADVGAVSNELIADPDVVRAVADALAQDERTAPYVLRVESRHGIVTLRGEVPDETTRQAAVDIALGIPVVSSLRNQLAIGGAVHPAIALSKPSLQAHEPDPVSSTTVRP